MVEEQAAARVHRIGQTRPVTIYRYIVEDSVEEVKDTLAKLSSILLITSTGQRIRNMQKRKIWYAELLNSDSTRKAGEKAMEVSYSCGNVLCVTYFISSAMTYKS